MDENKIVEDQIEEIPAETPDATEESDDPFGHLDIEDPQDQPVGEEIPAEDEPAEETAEAEIPEAEEDLIDDTLLQRAFEAGFSITDARSFGTGSSLESAIEVVERRLQPSASETTAEEERGLDLDLDLSLDKDVQDPEVISAFEKLSAQVQKLGDSTKTLQQENKALKAELQSARTGSTTTEIDTFVASLGEAGTKLFGSGSTDTLGSRTVGARNRAALRDAAESIVSYAKANNRRAPSGTRLMQTAMAAAFPDHVQQMARDELTSKVKGRRKGATMRPSHSKGPQLTPEKRALQSVSAAARKLGWSEAEGGDSFDEAEGAL